MDDLEAEAAAWYVLTSVTQAEGGKIRVRCHDASFFSSRGIYKKEGSSPPRMRVAALEPFRGRRRSHGSN